MIVLAPTALIGIAVLCTGSEARGYVFCAVLPSNAHVYVKELSASLILSVFENP